MSLILSVRRRPSSDSKGDKGSRSHAIIPRPQSSFIGMGAPFSSVSGALPRVTKPGYGRFRGNGVQRPNEPHRRKPLRTDPSRRPPAQSNGTLAVDAVADGNDGVKVAALYLVSELPEKICSSRICVANYPGLWYRFRGRLGNGDRSEPTAGVGSGPTQVKISSHSPRRDGSV